MYLIHMLYTYFTALEVEWVPWSISRRLFLQVENDEHTCSETAVKSSFSIKIYRCSSKCPNFRLLHNTQ